MRGIDLFVISLVCFVITLYILSVLNSSACVVVITGESIRVHNCPVNPELFHSIAATKPFRD
ncbi:triple gene block protein III [Jasmine virus C]|uniref:triple gene block protein III n=1 Tax=Jasmine virus C TaxID=1853762 RepID=UPI0007DCF788|nr:triple gene block protein III [Jasmine virus C]ANH22488.1 triple gene block III [Jasmine virus C]AON75923.1 triple gene block protein III [Jasmine virus C]